ncbi:MAG TPA: SpoIIE family protein phosphatase [Chthoniobacteraceae bacterium]|jgi:sigma-B regulation protein RsbU (phosphoserine phosphatase)|nr:putative sensor protein [Chthoniobacter sp.]HEV7866105.1 SpoIIE family protein phosphatase [Chthoniobacteraceae bacterium]
MNTRRRDGALRVLLVEDDPDDALLVRELLTEGSADCRVETVTRLAQALDKLDTGEVDIVVSDLSLPDSSGIETFRRICEHPTRVPVVVLSGQDDEAMALRTVEEGAQDYLVKGRFDAALLVRAIRYAVKRAAADEALDDERGLLRSVVDNLLDSIYVKDAEGRYLLGNLAHTRQLGLTSPDAIVGKTSFDFFPEEIAQGFTADDREVMRTGLPIVNRHESVGAGLGPVRWLSTTKVPLRDGHGAIIGIVGIGRDITARKNAEQQLASYTEELREKNAEMEEDLKMAREVQQAFLTQQFPTFPRKAEPHETALRFVSQYLPTTTLGGDFFHVQPISDTVAGVFICDVMGHGVRAALVTAIQRTLVEELQSLAEDPAQFLTAMNAGLFSILRRSNSPMFTSAFYLVLDLVTGTLRYANAGHPRPLLVRRSAKRMEVLGAEKSRSGPALGVFEDSVYQAHETSLSRHDLVLLFTDGVYELEGPRGELYDQSLLYHAVEHRMQRTAEQILKETLDEVRSFSATGEFGDDVCMVGMEVQRLLAPGGEPLIRAD